MSSSVFPWPEQRRCESQGHVCSSWFIVHWMSLFLLVSGLEVLLVTTRAAEFPCMIDGGHNG